MEIPAVHLNEDSAEDALRWYADLMRDLGDLRDLLLRGAYAAGVRSRRITEITGVAGTTLTRIPLAKDTQIAVQFPPRDQYAVILRQRAARLFDQAAGTSEQAGFAHGQASAFQRASHALATEDERGDWLDGPARTDDTVLAVRAASYARAAEEVGSFAPNAAAFDDTAWYRARHEGMRSALRTLAEEITAIRARGEDALDPQELSDANAAINAETDEAFGRMAGMSGQQFAALSDTEKAQAFEGESPVTRGLRLQARALGADEDEYLELSDEERALMWARSAPKEHRS